MSKQRASRRSFLAGLGSVALAGAGGCLGDGSGSASTVVFHAGSLGPPFADAEPRFEDKTGVAVTRESWGSVEATRRITAQGAPADVLGVADFRLLRDRLIPEYGEWYGVFATNAMGILYRPDAPGAGTIGRDDWWETISREDVAVGIADPALDPAGYRALMTLELGAVPFEGRRLYGGTTRDRLRANAEVTTGNEIALETQLRSGELDYAITYRSLGRESDLPYLAVQPQVDLSRASEPYADHYASVAIETDTGTYVGAPIAYGITVPSVARDPDGGARFVEYVLAGGGRSIVSAHGLAPLSEPVVPAGLSGTVPDRIREHVSERPRIGALEL